ncbi:MAG TPA: ABC transporter ATP-binding protein, partial [Bacteroidota bacterium]|nr:ABC transporter ATP-binding protein [Bacteroidota bacterium]
GEKSRLALAKMLLQPANFLIMDEPTNHLDMRSKTVLQEALLEYEGAYVIVSHDRAFLDPLVNKVLEINTTGIRTFLGNVSDYLEKKKSERETKPSPVAGKSNLSDKERKRMEADLRRERYNLLKPYKDQFEKVEKEIAKMEARKKEIEEMMLDSEFYKNDEEAKKTAHEYTDLKKNLENAYYRWNELTEKMAGVEKGIIDGR